MTVSKTIENKIKQSQKGKILFVSDFIHIGNYDTVRKTLQRLTEKKIIVRISKGIYYYPETDEILGILLPTAQEIAKAIAKRDKARIIPTGAYAQHLLGISKQIPMNIVYLTDGSTRKIKIGNQTINFKRTSPKNLNYKSELSSLIIQALKSRKEKKLNKIETETLKKIIETSNEIKNIKKDMLNAPVWIQKIILEILSKIENELA